MKRATFVPADETRWDAIGERLDALAGNTIERVWDILYPGHPPLEALVPDYDGDIPDRVISREVECLATITDEDGNEATCPFAGVADVAVFDDTEEALWVCPDGHENSTSWWEL